MSDQITVTFGGREVVLTRQDGTPEQWYSPCGLRVVRQEGGQPWWWAQKVVGDYEAATEFQDSIQSAVSALESKLRQLRAELDGVLGVPMDERTYFNLCDSLAAQLAECKDELRRK